MRNTNKELIQGGLTNLRRDLTSPIGQVGDAVTKVVSVATEAAAEASGKIDDAKAKIVDLTKVELDVGTKNMVLHAGGGRYELWPPKVELDNVPDLSGLSPNAANAIKEIKEELKRVESTSLELAVYVWIVSAFLLSCAYLGLAVRSHAASGHRCEVLGPVAVFIVVFLLNMLVCISLWFVYVLLNKALNLGHVVFGDVNTGTATGSLFASSCISTAQCAIPLFLGLAFLIRRCCCSHRTKPTDRKISATSINTQELRVGDTSLTIPLSSPSSSHLTNPHRRYETQH